MTTGGGATVYVLYLGSTSNPDLGYRAVVLLPSGVVQCVDGAAGRYVETGELRCGRRGFA